MTDTPPEIQPVTKPQTNLLPNDLSALINHTQTMSLNSQQTDQEYLELKAYAPGGMLCQLPIANDRMQLFKTCLQQNNQHRNRYTDVYCLESTRVKIDYDKEKNLSTHPDMEYPYIYASDFIHANYVNGYSSDGETWLDKHYIAAQGPMNETAGHFWEMVIQENVSSIVMTTRCEERNKIKCFQYWPVGPGDEKIFFRS